MKKVVCFLLSAAALTVLSINIVHTGYEAVPGIKNYTIDSSKDNVEIRAMESKYKNEDINITLKIPVIEGVKDRSIQNSINSRIKKIVLGFRDSVKSEAQKDNAKIHPYEVFTGFFTSFNKNNLLSLTIELYSYTGGAHGMTYRMPFNIDLTTGNELLLKDLFKDGVNYKEIIDREISKKIEESGPGLFFEGAFKGISENQPYYIKDGAIVIYFPLYEIAPYAAGFPEFEIPFDIFGDGMKAAI